MGRIITVSATAAVIACVVGSTAALGYSPTLPGGNPSAAPTGPPSLPNCTTVEPPRGAPCFDALGMWEGQGSDVGPVYTQLHEASDCSSGCWKLSSVIFEGTNQRSALDHDIFVRMRWQNGTYISTYPNGPSWTAFWGPSWDKHDKDLYNLEAKLPPDYGNFPLWATTPDWEPATCHCCGSYGAYAGNDTATSDVLYGCGLPIHHHVNWVIEFTYYPGDSVDSAQ